MQSNPCTHTFPVLGCALGDHSVVCARHRAGLSVQPQTVRRRPCCPAGHVLHLIRCSGTPRGSVSASAFKFRSTFRTKQRNQSCEMSIRSVSCYVAQFVTVAAAQIGVAIEMTARVCSFTTHAVRNSHFSVDPHHKR